MSVTLVCPYDDQDCAGEECAEWESVECAARRLAHQASVRVLSTCSHCHGPADPDADLGRICLKCRMQLCGHAPVAAPGQAVTP